MKRFICVLFLLFLSLSAFGQPLFRGGVIVTAAGETNLSVPANTAALGTDANGKVVVGTGGGGSGITNLFPVPPNAVLVSTNGNDATAEMGDPSHPAASLQYAFLFVQTNAPTNGLVVCMPRQSFSLDTYSPSGCTVLASNVLTLMGNGSFIFFTNAPVATTLYAFDCLAGSVFTNSDYTVQTPVPDQPGDQQAFGILNGHVWWGDRITVLGPADFFFSASLGPAGASLGYPATFHCADSRFIGSWDNLLPTIVLRGRTNGMWEYYNNRVFITNGLYPSATDLHGAVLPQMGVGKLAFYNNTIEVYGLTNTSGYNIRGVDCNNATGSPLIFENNVVVATNSGSGLVTNIFNTYTGAIATNFSDNLRLNTLVAPTNAAPHIIVSNFTFNGDQTYTNNEPGKVIFNVGAAMQWGNSAAGGSTAYMFYHVTNNGVYNPGYYGLGFGIGGASVAMTNNSTNQVTFLLGPGDTFQIVTNWTGTASFVSFGANATFMTE